MKFIVKSKSLAFSGYFFRKSTSHSIAWTSFIAAARYFDSEEGAHAAMESCGICSYTVLPAPNLAERLKEALALELHPT